MAAYTHVGCKPSTGRRTTSKRLAGHRQLVAGRNHALTADFPNYRSLCGETVQGTEENVWGDEIRDHVLPAASGRTVTCQRCLKVMGQ